MSQLSSYLMYTYHNLLHNFTKRDSCKNYRPAKRLRARQMVMIRLKVISNCVMFTEQYSLKKKFRQKVYKPVGNEVKTLINGDNQQV